MAVERFQGQFSAEEKDSSTVVLEGLQASCVRVDRLDAAVETFGI